MKRVLIAVAVSLTALSALSYMPAIDHADGVAVRIVGLEESSGGSGLSVQVLRPADGPVRFSCEVANHASSSVDGKLSVVMSSDWIVRGLNAADVSLAPGEMRSFPFEAMAVSPVVDGLYAVRAVFSSAGRRNIEPVAVFRAGGVAPSPAFAENDKGTLPPGSAMPFARADGRYALRVGMYFGADDGRWLLDGEDDLERRVAAGTFSVSRASTGAGAEVEWSPKSGLPRDPWVNERPVKIDFGGIVTDGAFLIHNGAGRSGVVPLPGGEENASIHVLDRCDLQ